MLQHFGAFAVWTTLIIIIIIIIWQSPGLPGWRKVNFITVTHRPHHPNIAAGLYCLATSPGFLPTLCEKWSGFFYVHRVFLSYTRDRRDGLKSPPKDYIGNADKAPCPRALYCRGPGLEPGTSGIWKSEALTARPRQLLLVCDGRLNKSAFSKIESRGDQSMNPFLCSWSS